MSRRKPPIYRNESADPFQPTYSALERIGIPGAQVPNDPSDAEPLYRFSALLSFAAYVREALSEADRQDACGGGAKSASSSRTRFVDRDAEPTSQQVDPGLRGG
jgi:hypothetical protein